MMAYRHGLRASELALFASQRSCLVPDLVPLSTEVGNAAFEHVAHRHEPVLAEADTRRRSCRNGTSLLVRLDPAV